jgi:hypothetical protein
MVPVDVYAKVPCKVALEHPLFWAFAVGDMQRASAVMTAAIAKVFVTVLRFMRNLLFRVDRSGLPVLCRLTTNKESPNGSYSVLTQKA